MIHLISSATKSWYWISLDSPQLQTENMPWCHALSLLLVTFSLMTCVKIVMQCLSSLWLFPSWLIYRESCKKSQYDIQTKSHEEAIQRQRMPWVHDEMKLLKKCMMKWSCLLTSYHAGKRGCSDGRESGHALVNHGEYLYIIQTYKGIYIKHTHWH